jgi:hypothetical protein
VLSDLADVLPRAIAAAIVLQLFFHLLRTNWPSNYYSTSDLLGQTLSRRWYRYALFRFGPVIVAAAIVAVTGPDEWPQVFLSSLVFGLIHAFGTSGYALAVGAARNSLTTRQAVVDAGVFVLVVLASLTGALLSPLFRNYVPGFDKYVEVLLTGVVAAMAYTYLARWTAPATSSATHTELLATVPKATIDLTVRAAAKHRVDRDLALAVLVTEGLQRPGWLRRVERATGGRLRLSRTHGPFQNATDPTIPDEQSIEAAMASLHDAVLPRRDGYMYSTARLHYNIERHNRSDPFREVCEAAYYTLSSGIAYVSDRPGVDGSPMLRVISVDRVGAQWKIFGDISDDAVDVRSLVMVPEVRELEVSIQEGRYRRTWRTVVSIENEQVSVWASIVYPDGEVGPDKAITILLS